LPSSCCVSSARRSRACFIIDLPELGGADKLRKMDVPVRTPHQFRGTKPASAVSPELLPIPVVVASPAFTNFGGCQLPSPGGRIDGGSVFGQ